MARWRNGRAGNSRGPATARHPASSDAFRIRPRFSVVTAAPRSCATNGSGSSDVRAGTGATAANARDRARALEAGAAWRHAADSGLGGADWARWWRQAAERWSDAVTLSPHA